MGTPLPLPPDGPPPEDRLRANEQGFRLLVESVTDYAIFLLDVGGRVTSWNVGAERIKGYLPDEILGQQVDVFYTPEDRAEGRPSELLAQAAREGRVEEEGWRVRKDGTRFWASAVLTALRAPDGQLTGFAKVTRDLTDRRRAEDERVRLAQAQEAIRLRDEFMSIASHELKTPLTSLHLQLEGLRRRAAQPPVDGRFGDKVDKALRSCERLMKLVESLLDVSRISEGRVTLHPERFDAVESVAQVLAVLAEPARAARCPIHFEAEGAIWVTWDRLRFEQVLTNLMDNAFKYGAGAPVAVTLAKQEEQEVVLTVRDHGLGITPSDLPRVFGRFERAASARNYGGLGLGLYVAHELVTAHGGTVTAENGAGGGALFTVRLPPETPAPAAGPRS